MDTVLPVTELNEQVRQKATIAIRRLERLVEETQTVFVWNNLFFRDQDGCYYATFHDYIDIQPDCFRTPGHFRLSLYWIGNEIGVASDIHQEVGYNIGLIDSAGRQWMFISEVVVECTSQTAAAGNMLPLHVSSDMTSIYEDHEYTEENHVTTGHTA